MPYKENFPLYQCAPNFSEGRDHDIVSRIARVISNTSGIDLRDFSADPDHNRCVMTFIGCWEAVHVAALAATGVAIESIDMNRHSGVHPRIGAIDVIPIIPIRGASREMAAELARTIGYEIAERYDLPVYFYEWASFQGRTSALPELRRGEFENLIRGELSGVKTPDAGPAHAHPTAGAVVVGARGPLVAYNVNLAESDDRIAKKIASQLRKDRSIIPELAGVRALGLFLERKGLSQVSMNLTQPREACLPDVFQYVRNMASELGIREVESEIIGVIPPSALGSVSPESIGWHDFKPGQILPFEPDIV